MSLLVLPLCGSRGRSLCRRERALALASLTQGHQAIGQLAEKITFRDASGFLLRVRCHNVFLASAASDYDPMARNCFMRTVPSGNRAVISSSPPMATMYSRSVLTYISVRLSSRDTLDWPFLSTW